KFPISINKATLEELCALKGVGPKLAEKMIAYRDSVGGFKTASDLLKVPGIGKKKSKNILHDVIFD
ncbi:MAG TPA: helix-hairpin-helix domain-containing protein, partial [Fibrobacteraceae bacterium]|nr:helix-hairpin-helix domain-containing protein [Fibrobacteraceae bacterium]